MKLTLNKNVIALQKGYICLPNDGMDNRVAVSTIQAHLMQYRYMLTEDAFDLMSKADLSHIVNFNNDIISYLKVATGGKYNHQPLYKNFPQEVMSLTDTQLYWNALRHYWSNGTWEPKSVVYERPIAFEKVKYTMLESVSIDKFNSVFTDLVSINTSLTPNDLDVVKWFVNNDLLDPITLKPGFKDGVKLVFPDVIPFKENLCTLAGMGLSVPVKTTTDVLRIAVHMSGGDISLPAVPPAKIKSGRWSKALVNNPERDKFKFKHFKRPERKYLLELLEKTHCDPKEMVLKDQRWIRLGEILHPGEYAHKFPRAAKAFKAIRDGEAKSWNSDVDKAFRATFEIGLIKLSERPGEFIRRLDLLIRKNLGTTDKAKANSALIMKYLSKILPKVSNKVLFEVWTHFEGRDKVVSNRSIFIKGAKKRTPLPSLPAIPKTIIEHVQKVIWEALSEKFSNMKPLGSVWIDERLKLIPLPTNMRSMDFSTKPVIRGQRVPFDNPETKVIRSFVHWMDPRGNEDLDLSATFIGTKGKFVTNFSQHMKVTLNGRNIITHSGDVRHRRGPCAEYIDIDLAGTIESGYHYAVIDVRNYNGGTLKSVESRFGLMERDHPECGNIWLPETVTNCRSLESSSSNTIACILDLREKQYIYLDVDSSGIPVATGDQESILAAVDQYTKPPKISVYDLIYLHVQARGKLVSATQNPDTLIKYEDFECSYQETAKWMGV